MKKAFLIIISACLLGLLIVANSPRLMSVFLTMPYGPKAIWGSDRYSCGDLYGMCYISDFQNGYQLEKPTLPLKRYDTLDRTINLVVLGDCNLAPPYGLSDSMLAGVKRYTFYDFRKITDISIAPDTSAKNVLLIERTERALVYFADSNYILDKMHVGSRIKQKRKKTLKYLLEMAPHLAGSTLHNPDVNQNLDNLLFDYSFLTGLKQMKADFNYKLFNRPDNNVVVSPDQNYLLYGVTVNAGSENSSFIPVSDADVEKIITSLNAVYDYYRSKGFDEIYFAGIPNTVSIMYPQMGKYNHLLERVQDHKDLKMKSIDIYHLFKSKPDDLYLKSDTHWTLNGFFMWVNEFNRQLALPVNSPDANRPATASRAAPVEK